MRGFLRHVFGGDFADKLAEAAKGAASEVEKATEAAAPRAMAAAFGRNSRSGAMLWTWPHMIACSLSKSTIFAFCSALLS